MSINMNSYPFAVKYKAPKPCDPFSPKSALQTLRTLLLDSTHESVCANFKVLPFRKGRPLAGSTSSGGDLGPNWHMGCLNLGDSKIFLEDAGVSMSEESFVYLGFEEYVVYWAIDLSEAHSLVNKLDSRRFCFVVLRVLMVATNWSDARAMGDLAVAGHARALPEWHNISRFCGHCGGKAVSMEAGRRKQSSNELCKNRIYPQIDPV